MFLETAPLFLPFFNLILKSPLRGFESGGERWNRNPHALSSAIDARLRHDLRRRLLYVESQPQTIHVLIRAFFRVDADLAELRGASHSDPPDQNHQQGE